MDPSDIELALSPSYVARLITKLRGIEGREAVTDPDSGSNPTDDNMVGTLQTSPDDLSALEVRKEIEGLNERQQCELVALMWIGRGDVEPEDWPSIVELARDSREIATASYILGNPLAAEYCAEGLQRIGHNPELTDE
jgi:hypothetical protein